MDLDALDDEQLDQVTGGMGGGPVIAPSPSTLPLYLIQLALGFNADNPPPKNGIFGLGGVFGVF